MTLVLSSAIVACSSSIPQQDSGLELLPADAMMEGPGVFTGKTGSYNAVGNKKKKVTVQPQSTQAPAVPTNLENADLSQTSKILEEKIKQSQRNTIELELLKRQVDQKLNAQ